MNPYQPESQPPAWISASTEQMKTRERSFVASVYGWMFGGLLLTAFASLWVAVSPSMQAIVLQNRGVSLVLMLVELGLVFAISAGIRRFSPATAASMFLVFSLLNGLTLSFILFAYTSAVILQAFVVAAGMFGAMSVYGTVTKRDLTSWGSFLMMGLIGIILCSVVNMFLRSGTMSFAISVIGVFLFLGLTAYDTQKLRAFATADGPMRESLSIYGALALYLDFINLFLFLLRLFGGGRRR